MSLDIEGVLSAHVPLGDDAEGIEQCSCGVIAIWRRGDDEVRYLPTHAEGPDLRWHVAHVAAVLREQIEGALAEARRDALTEAAGEVERVERVGLTPANEIPSTEREWFNGHPLRNVDGFQRHRPVVADWLRGRAVHMSDTERAES